MTSSPRRSGGSFATFCGGLVLASLCLAVACGGGARDSARVRAGAETPAPCPPLPSPIPIPIAERKYDEQHELFDMEDVPTLWAAAPEDEAGARYRKTIAARIQDVAPRALLERQRAVYVG